MKFAVLMILAGATSFAQGQTYLRADGVTDTYSLIDSVFGKGAHEVPDCIHDVKHIRQAQDEELKKQVFLFSIHVTPDNDMCTKFDRQRVEIKTYNPSPDNLKGFRGDTVTMSWNFKLDKAFKPSSGFTHIHQLKAVDGDDGSPVMTLTPRYNAKGDILELIHIDSKKVTTKLTNVKLAAMLGTWVHVTENITYNPAGKYSVTIKAIGTGETLLNYSNNKIDMWRDGATFVRPKWGIYRSLLNKERLRDEVVRFNDFCIGKGTALCS